MVNHRSFFKKFSTIAIFILSLTIVSIYACTGIELQSQDGVTITGRTVEFGRPIKLKAAVVPRHYQFNGTIPDGKKGISYRSKYAAVGVTAFDQPAIVDGINEKGLMVGMFYFPGFAEYTPLTIHNRNYAMSPTDFPNWILTQFATVDEVRKEVTKNRVVVVPTSFQVWGGVPPMHYIVYDSKGNSIVIEPIKGELRVFDNPIGTFTNSPEFPWHLTNLANYINLTPVNVSSKKIKDYTIKSLGEGSGLLGLPGDFTPPSRFIRAAIFSSAAPTAATATAGVFEAFHILNQFDIPPGAVRDSNTDDLSSSDITLATTVKDSKNLKYYLRTFENQNIRVIDLKQFDPNEERIIWIKIDQQQPPATDLSKKGED